VAASSAPAPAPARGAPRIRGHARAWIRHRLLPGERVHDHPRAARVPAARTGGRAAQRNLSVAEHLAEEAGIAAAGRDPATTNRTNYGAPASRTACIHRYPIDVSNPRRAATSFTDAPVARTSSTNRCRSSAEYRLRMTRKGGLLYEELIPRLLRKEQDILLCLSSRHHR